MRLRRSASSRRRPTSQGPAWRRPAAPRSRPRPLAKGSRRNVPSARAPRSTRSSACTTRRQRPVEPRREAGGHERIEVVALAPVSLLAQARRHSLVVTRARQRVADGDADVVGQELAHERPRRLHLAPALAGVAELQEEPDADAVRPEASNRRRVCSTEMPFSIASRMRCDPDSAPSHTSRAPARASARTFSSVIRSARVWQRNGVLEPRRCDGIGPGDEPARLEAEDVVAEPEVVGRVALAEKAHLGDDAGPATGCGTCCRRRASRTSCIDTGSRGSSRRSARSSRGAARQNAR